MGFLTEGNTFTWEEASEKPIEVVRKHGIAQFLAIYEHVKNRTRDSLRWGDEIEYIILKVDEQNKTMKLSLRGHEIIDHLEELEKTKPQAEMLWRPEYAKYMVEGTPGSPFGALSIADLLNIEPSMIERRKAIEAILKKDERVVTIASFPLLGAVQQGPYSEPHYEPGGPVARSVFTPDEIIHPHFRFSTLTANIRNRRGSKVEINVPLYKDKNTSEKPLPIPESPLNAPQKENNIYMDSMAFGMGCCCLQCTFQCCNINEARAFYDQLTVLSPIMLAMTAAAPIFRGYLADIDARWQVISGSVDDRTEEERGLKPLKECKYKIPKSRYDSVDCYIANDDKLKDKYNDIDIVHDKSIKDQLLSNGVDERLATHISHLFIRDPLVIYRDKLLIDDTKYSDHFENIQSTNWQTVRFKPPPPNSDIGWRVEFRPMEIQLTDFENSSYVIFIVLITRILSAFDINFYIPLSKVEENMRISQLRGALSEHKFYFRKSLIKKSKVVSPKKEDDENHSDNDDEYELMTINEIFNGKKETNYCGLIPLIEIYMDTINLYSPVRSQISKYLSFLSKKASGELVTTATWIRNFVTSHPDYKGDSVVTQKINYDLMDACHKIGRGELMPPELLGDFLKDHHPTRLDKKPW